MLYRYEDKERYNMPVHKTKSGGYQWGKTGKVYYGKDAKKKAQKQGLAIRLSGWKETKK